MKPVLVIFASSEGETRRIAEHVVQYLLSRGIAARLREIEGCEGAIDSSRYHAVVVVASIHVGRHAHEMIRFVRKNRFERARRFSAQALLEPSRNRSKNRALRSWSRRRSRRARAGIQHPSRARNARALDRGEKKCRIESVVDQPGCPSTRGESRAGA
jgi:hypothetical protein